MNPRGVFSELYVLERLFCRRCLGHFAIVAITDNRGWIAGLSNGVAAARVAVIVGIDKPAYIACECQSYSHN